MASIMTQIGIMDRMTAPLRSIMGAVNGIISAMENVDAATDRGFDTSAVLAARQAYDMANVELVEINESLRKAAEKQQNLNTKIEHGTGAIGKFAGAFLGLASISAARNWFSESINLANTQTGAEKQLSAVLANVGATEQAFDAIKKKASEIQGYSMYGDEAMLSGAGELATYIKDTDALAVAMGTLSNYAAGMSGGAEVGARQMVDYATQLGKALDGTYDGLRKKGFELTEAQKKIIDTGTDMEKALVLDEVISQSWANLAEQMANTPMGKITQMQNAFGDIREEVGMKLYPAIVKFADTMNKHMPQIGRILNGLAIAVGVFISALTTGIDYALAFGSAVADNWWWISPIIYGVIAALLAYAGYLAVVNGLELISNGIKIAGAIASFAYAAATGMQASATAAATAAQYGLNTAILASPVTWIVVAVLAVVAAMTLFTSWLYKAEGATSSVTGAVFGYFAVLGANLMNGFIVPQWNMFAAFANFFGNVWNDPITAVHVLFYDLAQNVIGYIISMAEAIESVINKIPGVEVNITSGLNNFYNQLEEASKKVKDEAGWIEYVKKMDFVDYKDAYEAGYQFGQGVEEKVTGFFNPTGLDIGSGFDTSTIEGIGADTKDIKNSVSATAEELKFLRDLAETEAINRYTTAEIKVDMGGVVNHVSQNTDLDGVMAYLTETLEENMSMVAEGVHV